MRGIKASPVRDGDDQQDQGKSGHRQRLRRHRAAPGNAHGSFIADHQDSSHPHLTRTMAGVAGGTHSAGTHLPRELLISRWFHADPGGMVDASGAWSVSHCRGSACRAGQTAATAFTPWKSSTMA
jgi:hypothetical protein